MAMLPESNPRYNDPVFTTYRYRLEVAANTPPVADADLSTDAPGVGQIVTVDASSSYDAETASADLVYEWDLDYDGLYDDDVGMIIETSYPTEGIYYIDLRVTDHAARKIRLMRCWKSMSRCAATRMRTSTTEGCITSRQDTRCFRIRITGMTSRS